MVRQLARDFFNACAILDSLVVRWRYVKPDLVGPSLGAVVGLLYSPRALPSNGV